MQSREGETLKRHTIIVAVADEAHPSMRRKTAEEISDGLSRHIQAWAGWPIKVVEYHYEDMIERGEH